MTGSSSSNTSIHRAFVLFRCQVDYVMYRGDPNLQRLLMRHAINNNNIGPMRSISSGRNGDIYYHDMDNMARHLENFE